MTTFTFNRQKHFWALLSIVAVCSLVVHQLSSKLFLGLSSSTLPTEQRQISLIEDQISHSKIGDTRDTYHVNKPTDMWRRPSKVPSWNPVPLVNSCIGGRINRSKKCNFEEDGLRYYGPGMGLTPDDLMSAWNDAGGDLILYGDSIDRFWHHELALYLGLSTARDDNDLDLERDIKESMLRFSPKSLRFQRMVNLYFNVKAFHRSAETKGAQKQTLFNARCGKGDLDIETIRYFTEQYPREFQRQKPIFVINHGVHFNLVSNGRSGLKTALKRMAMACYETGARCIFRETTPQFFDTKAGDGLYPGDGQERKCFSEAVTSFSTLSRWRNDVLYEVMTEMEEMGPSKQGGFLKVMPIFDKLVGLPPDAHMAPGDCTHPSMEMNVWEPVHLSLTEVLLDINSNVNIG